MKAAAVFREKRVVYNQKTGGFAIAGIKIWEVPKSKDYPQGRKFSLFLVFEGATLIGIDNHKPKGPHLHLGNQEIVYDYQNDDKLLADFWGLVRKVGFEP